MDKKLAKRIGKNISVARWERGESQEAFAARVGVTRGFLSDIERGKRAISIDTLVRLCKATKLSANELLTA
jgi:transcriptional regulator with XRE-family HTH domain